MIDTERIINLLSSAQDIIETEGLNNTIKSLSNEIENAIRAKQILTEIGLLELLEIATRVKVWKFQRVSITLDVPWQDQTRARHLYGSCFPENIFRDVITEDGRNGPHVFRRYHFKSSNGSVVVRFYRPTFTGDKIDGCVVRYHTIREPYHHLEQERKYLSVSCPVRRYTQ